MENNLGFPVSMQSFMPANNLAGMETMYPDLYTRLNPHIRNTADMVSDDAMQRMTGDEMNRLTDETVARSNVMDDPPAGHNRDTVRDVARILLLRELFDRNRRSGFMPFLPPFFLVPFGDGRRHGRDWY